MKESKRVSINFSSINNGNYTIIDPKKIAKSRERIRKAMEPIIKEFKRKERQSINDSKKYK